MKTYIKPNQNKIEGSSQSVSNYPLEDVIEGSSLNLELKNCPLKRPFSTKYLEGEKWRFEFSLFRLHINGVNTVIALFTPL